MPLRRPALLLLAFATLSSHAPFAQVASVPPGTSLDCSKMRGRTQRMICSDPALAALDQHMNELFAITQAEAIDLGALKKSQRTWLRERDDCDTTDCMSTSYERRLTMLTTQTGRFATTYSKQLCGLFETAEERRSALDSRSGVEDINNDDQPDTSPGCPPGTTNVPCAIDADQDDRPMTIELRGFDWNTYTPLGRAPFRHDGRTFIYHSRDAALAEPSYISYVTPSNREVRVCDFDTRNSSATVDGGDAVCAAVESNEGIEFIELAITTPDSIATSRSDTHPKATGLIDIDNDGLDESVVELRYQNDAGQGCTFNYYELLAEDRTLLGNANNRPVRELQGLSDGGYRERDCGTINNRLFKFEDSVFYETNIDNNSAVPHEVRRLDGIAVSRLCTFERNVTTKVKTIF